MNTTNDANMPPEFASIGDRAEPMILTLHELRNRAAAGAKAEYDAAADVKPCQRHPDQSRTKFEEPETGLPKYSACPRCKELRAQVALVEAGLPLNLLHCTFDNFTASTPDEQAVLAKVREFADKPRGVLIATGNFGTGKTHLAAAITRQVKGARFITHGQLLGALRDTYSDRKAVDILELASKVELLVLDELGASAGGKDDAPLLHTILCERYDWHRPTVITTNLAIEQLALVVGPRVMDRLTEAAYAVLTFAGSSHRRSRRAEYVATQPEPELVEAVPWFKKRSPKRDYSAPW